MRLPELDREKQSRIKEYLQHTSRKEANLCIYNSNIPCIGKNKYSCRTNLEYIKIYNSIDDLLFKNPELEEEIKGSKEIKTTAPCFRFLSFFQAKEE